MKLFFENSWGTRKILSNNIQPEQVMSEIQKFINKCNEGRPEDKKFRSYYIRNWINEDGEFVYDVGSHSEFFYLVKDEEDYEA